MNIDSKTPLSARKARPQTIGGVVGNLLRALGGRASDADLKNKWPEIIGPELSEIAILKSIRVKDKKFSISVSPKNAALALPLSYRLDEIKLKINNYFGYEAVQKMTLSK